MYLIKKEISPIHGVPHWLRPQRPDAAPGPEHRRTGCSRSYEQILCPSLLISRGKVAQAIELKRLNHSAATLHTTPSSAPYPSPKSACGGPGQKKARETGAAGERKLRGVFEGDRNHSSGLLTRCYSLVHTRGQILSRRNNKTYPAQALAVWHGRISAMITIDHCMFGESCLL
jgi:hypothetical protein